MNKGVVLGVIVAIAAFAGGGQRFHRTIVLEWRLPIAVAAVVFGALLAIGGAIFQSLTRNPLGSPDVIGFDAGSYTAAGMATVICTSPDIDYMVECTARSAGSCQVAVL